MRRATGRGWPRSASLIDAIVVGVVIGLGVLGWRVLRKAELIPDIEPRVPVETREARVSYAMTYARGLLVGRNPEAASFEDHVLDRWGTEMRRGFASEGGGVYVLTLLSAGPDSVWDTRDDVEHRVRIDIVLPDGGETDEGWVRVSERDNSGGSVFEVRQRLRVVQRHWDGRLSVLVELMDESGGVVPGRSWTFEMWAQQERE